MVSSEEQYFIVVLKSLMCRYIVIMYANDKRGCERFSVEVKEEYNVNSNVCNR